MKYTEDDLTAAMPAVRQKRLSMKKASEDYHVPLTTLFDNLSGKSRKRTKGQERLLSDEEENALVNYVMYMGSQSFPMNRSMIKCYAREILARSGENISQIVL